MKLLRQGLCVALAGTGLSVAGTTAAQAAPDPTPSPLAQVRADADGGVSITREPATGKAGFVRAAKNGDLLPDNDQAPAAKADAYLTRNAAAFGAPRSQLERAGVQKTRYGTTVSYTQLYRGVPVFGGMLLANLDRSGDLTAVNGFVAPDLKLSTDPDLSESAAEERAVQAVQADPPSSRNGDEAETSDLSAKDTSLVIYRQGAIRGERGEPTLTYVTEVVDEAGSVREQVFVSATTGKLVNRYSMIDTALDRELYEADSTRQLTKVWGEGDPLPGSLNDDQESMVRSTGESYWFFANAFGRDSYDGAGATMKTINNDPAIKCPNANWNGATTNYCDGVSSDDVVAHEWGHAYTEKTHGLIYQWQSGALNESYSDIWGETVDLINNRLDEEEGDLTTKRPVGQCSTNSPATPLVKINSPASLARDCMTGGVIGDLSAPVTGDVVAPTRTVSGGGTPTDGCTAYQNAEAVLGKVVLVDRGFCTFAEKATVAKDAGAKALIIGNNDPAPVSFSSPDKTLPPTVSIGLTDREDVRGAVNSGQSVNVTLSEKSPNRTDSYRWLVGEKSEAFGGAIRDMWSPTCYGDPAKVSDAEYKCSTSDNGGVHSNSGVPNRGYSLLVDGGDFNGVSVAGLGLTKSAAIYFRAMTAYQTPTSDFTDHADSLEAACTDLSGQTINELSTKEKDARPSDQKISASDCAQVTAMTQAVELRKEPAQCDFQPMLGQNPPPTCGKGYTARTLFSDDFEKGLGKWSRHQQVVDKASKGYPWDTRSIEGRRGKVAFGPTPNEGQCTAGNDISGVDSIVSPSVRVPAKGRTKLSFAHQPITEMEYDGGNVKVSVDKGEFRVVPKSAYLYNPPTRELATDKNTNPMAGEAAFTGTDGGRLTSKWGTSIIDVSALAKPGQSVRFRFDVGRDGCGGLKGWAVDDVKVTVCAAKTALSARHRPQPSVQGRRHRLDVQVKRAGSAGPKISEGRVVVTRNGKQIGAGRVVRGVAKVALPRRMKAGRHRVRATYRPSSYAVAGSSTTVRFRVVRR